METDKKWYRIYKSNRQGARKVVDEVRGEDLASHRVSLLNEDMSPEERDQGWSHHRANKGTSKPALEHPSPRKRHRPDSRSKRRR
jgi:hypothetical protein